ncbi:BrnT family toxin [Candidatus Poribacteria bacterium]|nr:BrnT family toxin [Candidatus Poribacteria bacterium]
MKTINWNTEKSLALKESRGVCFEDVVFHIEQGDILDDYEHPNQQKYGDQRIMVVGISNYAYLVPYVENRDEVFLKTIIPSRRATERYFGGKHED